MTILLHVGLHTWAVIEIFALNASFRAIQLLREERMSTFTYTYIIIHVTDLVNI